MQIEALRVFCDVVRHHSFSQAASANGISQSAASQVVQQLEDRLDVQLIDRSKRPWILTADGRFFFDGCQDLVERYQALEDALRRRRQATGYTVRVAAIYSVGLQDLSQYVERFRAAMPGSDVHLEYVHPNRVYECVLTDEADLGLISFAHNGRELTAIPWREEPMVLTCLPGHRLARGTQVTPIELAGERFVAFDRGLAIRREVDRYLKQHGADVAVVAEFDNIETIKRAVEDGAGVAILPEPTLEREMERNTLRALPLAGAAFVRPLSVIHRRKRRLNAAVHQFVELLVNHHGPAASRPASSAPGGNGEPPRTKPKNRRRG
jgi:DNA-binding transcriptional LysR family regulator